MKKIALVLGLAAGLVAIQASALPTFQLAGGYQGPVKIKFSNFESFTETVIVPGAQNFGVVDVTQILDPSNNVLWNKGQDGGFISGVFDGLTVASVSGVAPNINVHGSGGLIDLYLNPSPINAAQGISGYAAAGGGCAANQLCYNTVSNVAGGGVFLNLALVSGITTDPTQTIDATFTADTLPFAGTANAYYDVTGGAFASTFHTLAQPSNFGNRDFFAQNTFCTNGQASCNGTGVGDWQLVSDDPIRGSVPEPGTLALLAAALLGLGFVGANRRRTL